MTKAIETFFGYGRKFILTDGRQVLGVFDHQVRELFDRPELPGPRVRSPEGWRFYWQQNNVETARGKKIEDDGTVKPGAFLPIVIFKVLVDPSERCPRCDCNWFISPPAKIDKSTSVRCVNCKEVFTEGMLEEIRLRERAS